MGWMPTSAHNNIYLINIMAEIHNTTLYSINFRGTEFKLPDGKDKKRFYYDRGSAVAACKAMVREIRQKYKADPEYSHDLGCLSISMFEIIEYEIVEKTRYLV